MIIDSIDRWETYRPLLPHLDVAMRFALTLADQPVGRYECKALPPGEVYAMVQEGETRAFEEGRMEAHREYADIQIMLKGGETVYYANIAELSEAEAYHADICFYYGKGQPLLIRAGMFYLVFPQDGHMPCRHTGGTPEVYRKIVLKVKL